MKVPLLDQTYALFSVVRLGLKRTGTGNLESTFAVKDGVFTISKFTARSDAVDVTATGTLDLVQREISAQARGQLRGVAGLATSPVTSMLNMQVSGPIGQVRVQPEGPVRAADGVVKGAAKLTGGDHQGRDRHAAQSAGLVQGRRARTTVTRLGSTEGNRDNGEGNLSITSGSKLGPWPQVSAVPSRKG
ncbi:MAG: hypothetical protein ABI680_09600 [Chthoniobacteraceae bacterium]